MNAGDRYGGYQIVRYIGRGAMGEVFLARDTESGAEVALKIVRKGTDPEDLDIIAAERLGAELQKRLSGVDRRVVAVHKYGEISDDLVIEMEYVDGEDLSAILAHGPVLPGFAVHVAREVCEMLENLSAFTTTVGESQFAGVIHGDLKPRNVRINKQNQVKVLDFGIAKALTHTRKYTTNVFASTAYCSPERLETQNMDTHSDLWSLGVLLYQMLANRLPFEEPNKERLERRIRSSAPPDPLPPACPEPLRLIIFKILARDPAQRYQTARETNDDLARFQKGQPIIAKPVRSAPPFDQHATVRTSVPVEEVALSERTVRSSRPVLPVVVPGRRNRLLGCLAVLGVFTVLMLVFVSIEMSFWGDADRLKADLQSERVTNLEQAWTRYQALEKRPHLSLLLWSTKRELRKRLVTAADEVIAEYRNSDAPTVYEPQWVQARDDLARALELDGGDDVSGRLRLCVGHIDRIDASGLRNPARQKKLNTAANMFYEAADLWKHSPDPYLALATLYTYDLTDVEKVEEALKKASHYGHPVGKKETAQLADAYRRSADRFWRQSKGFPQMPDQEREYLDKARQNYIHAQDLYQQAGLFGDAARSEILALQGQQKVDQRLDELQEGTFKQ